MLKLLVLLTKRQPPSSRLRMSACFDGFREQGIDPTGMPIPSGFFGRLGILRAARRHDVVIIQKKTSFRLVELKLLRWINPRMIFDMDDAVMFHELEHHRPLTGKNMIKFLRTINHCATVVAGNQFLAGFARANCAKVEVLPTPVDVRKYRAKDYTVYSKVVVVGWLGVAGNLHYLKKLEPVFKKLAKEYPQFRLKIVSNDFIDMEGVPIIKERWSLEGELESLRSFDIGIMPLDDSLWARGKCGYKILQYFGVGIPVVASPVEINQEFISDRKLGRLATTNETWYAAVSELIADKKLRERVGEVAIRSLNESYSLEIYINKYASVIKK